jgi:hypothetical protein
VRIFKTNNYLPILFIIFCNFANLELSATNLEFPAGIMQLTPGHQGIKRHSDTDDALNVIYMRVPLAKPEDQFTCIQIAATDIKLYFPLDGHQPTTQEAEKWSGANIQSEAVTNWYI